MIIQIRGEVDKNMEKSVLDQLATDPLSPVEIRLDSMGGDLFSGLAIYQALSQRNVEVFVDGFAGSIASVIALSGEKPPKISKTGRIAIHNAQIEGVSGDHNNLLKAVDALQKYSEIVASVYKEKTLLDADEIKIAMDAEMIFVPDEAVKLGFASEIFENVRIVASLNQIDMNLLEQIRNSITAEPIVETPPAPGAESEQGVEAPTMELDEATMEQVIALIDERIAAALAGQSEEVANAVAAIFNQVKSEGIPPQKVQIPGTPAQVGSFEDQAVAGFFAAKNKLKEGGIK